MVIWSYDYGRERHEYTPLTTSCINISSPRSSTPPNRRSWLFNTLYALDHDCAQTRVGAVTHKNSKRQTSSLVRAAPYTLTPLRAPTRRCRHSRTCRKFVSHISISTPQSSPSPNPRDNLQLPGTRLIHAARKQVYRYSTKCIKCQTLSPLGATCVRVNSVLNPPQTSSSFTFARKRSSTINLTPAIVTASKPS